MITSHPFSTLKSVLKPTVKIQSRKSEKLSLPQSDINSKKSYLSTKKITQHATYHANPQPIDFEYTSKGLESSISSKIKMKSNSRSPNTGHSKLLKQEKKIDFMKAVNEKTISDLKSVIRVKNTDKKSNSAIKDSALLNKNKSLQFCSNRSNMSLLNDIAIKPEIECSSNETGKKSKKSSSSLNATSEQKHNENNYTNQTFHSEKDVKKEDRKFSILDIPGTCIPFASSNPKRSNNKPQAKKDIMKSMSSNVIKCLFLMATNK